MIRPLPTTTLILRSHIERAPNIFMVWVWLTTKYPTAIKHHPITTTAAGLLPARWPPIRNSVSAWAAPSCLTRASVAPWRPPTCCQMASHSTKIADNIIALSKTSAAATVFKPPQAEYRVVPAATSTTSNQAVCESRCTTSVKMRCKATATTARALVRYWIWTSALMTRMPGP